MTKEAVREGQRAWLEQVMRETGKPLSKIASEAGRPGTTLTRFYNDDKYSGVLSPTVVQSISEATGIPGPGAILVIPHHGSMPTLREDGTLYEANQADPRNYAIAALISENPNAHAWTMHSDVLRLAGISEGDILIIDQSAEPRDGDVVCAQIENGVGAKTVFRIYQRPALVGAALDIMSVRPEIVDGQRVRIAGVMTNMLRTRTSQY